MNFKEIIKINRENVKNIIKMITKSENEDLEQEVYLKVWKNSDKYTEKGSFKGWVNTIAKNVSKKFKCHVGTIKSRLYNAKKELANKLSDLL